MPFQLITAPAAAEPVGLAAAVGAGVLLNEPSPDPLDGGGNWRRGYTLVGEACGAGSRYLINPRVCDENGDILSDVPDPDEFEGWVAGVDGQPFVIGAGVKCGTFYSPKDLDVWKLKAQRRLELCQWADLAQELWTGEKAKLEAAPNRFLASHEANVIEASAYSVVDGIASMDASFASCSCGGPRVIHVPIGLVAHLAHESVIEKVGARWYSPAGNLVVWDDGYPGTGPDTAAGVERPAPAAGTFWIYGTTQIVAKLGPIEFPGGDDWQNYVAYETNDVIARAQRYAMASWLCCHLAALIDTAP